MWGTKKKLGGAFGTPFLLLKILIFVSMNKTYIYYAIGVAVLIGGYFLLSNKKSNSDNKPSGINLDPATLKTFIDWLWTRGYTVEQLPEDVKSDLTPEQIDTIKEALKNRKA